MKRIAEPVMSADNYRDMCTGSFSALMGQEGRCQLVNLTS